MRIHRLKRKKRTSHLRQRSATPVQRRPNANKDDASPDVAQNKTTKIDKGVGRQAKRGTLLDGSYEDELAEALRRSKLDEENRTASAALRQSRFDAHFEHPAAKIGPIYDEGAILQQALRLSKKATEAENEADEELRLALEMSRLEQESNDGPYDPDRFGETSRMGAMRNGHGDTAHVSLPELEIHECGWNDPSEEPPPPYEP